MKTHIKLTEPIYKVDKKTGEVSCYIEAQAQLEIFNFIFFDNIPMFKKLMSKFQMAGYDEIRGFTGVARLKEDEWDETLGRRIAESKCKRSIYRFYMKVFGFISEEITREVHTLDDIWDTVWTAKMIEDRHFKQLTGVDVNENNN